jgi:death-on-curing protein
LPTIVYLTFSDYCRAAAAALGLDLVTATKICDRGLAESALAAPAAGFGDHEEYPSFPAKVALLLQRVAGNHALPDGNKRTALLCAILFCNINGFAWEPPQADDPDGTETAEIVESAAAGHLPLAALSAWVDFRLREVPRIPETTLLPPGTAGHLPSRVRRRAALHRRHHRNRRAHHPRRPRLQPGRGLRPADQR